MGMWFGRFTAVAVAAAAVVLSGSAALGAPAQPEEEPASAPAEERELPPMLKLGARAGAMSQRIPAASAVVIAEDGEAFLYAISKWRLTLRFPVLIDDGSWASAQRIARFVRAYKPATVFRARVPEGEAELGRREEGFTSERLDRAIAAAWTVQSQDEPLPPERLQELWDKLKFEPFGVVVADAADPTWPAAVALAAGHGQPVVWLAYPGKHAGNIGGALSADELRELDEAIVTRMRARGLAFEGLGGDIDAITLCFDGPTKVAPSSADKALNIALSDCLGRAFDESQRPTVQRWAWCGQIVGGGAVAGAGGSESSSAYDAMCSLFLRPRLAWLFDGYDDKEPFSAYDMTLAATALEREGVRTVLDDNASRGADDFRRRAAGISWPWRDREAAAKTRRDAGEPEKPADELPPRRGIDAELIMVNTSGNPEFFDLKPGQARPGDLPFLRHPAAVYFVHSWSAANIANVEFVAGRWRQRGAYAYCGSVHEPFLQGFVQTPLVAARLVAGVPWGAAVRADNAQPWKIVCLGDPLMMVRGDVPMAEGSNAGGMALSFPGLSDLHSEMATALKAREFAKALRLLSMMGRDRDAALLLGAILTEERAGAGRGGAGQDGEPRAAAVLLTPEAAMAGLMSAYFAGDVSVFARVLSVAMERIRTSKEWGASALLDTAWHAMWPRLDFLSPGEVEVLGRSVRGATRERDGAEYQRAARGVRGR